MPQGKGTYGSKRGRPPKKTKAAKKSKLKDMIAMIFTPKLKKKQKKIK